MVDCWTFGDPSIDCDEDELDPYYEAYRILNVLASSCLLEDAKDWVKMHDVVRSMAVWIAEEDTLVMSGMELDETPSVRMWKHKKRVSLTGSNIKALTQVPECHHLLSLFLNSNEQLNVICSGFFESMGMLTVLNLSDTGTKELPESISGLVSLKYLDISHTKIRELPVALIKLEALKFLDLSGVSEIGMDRNNQMICKLSSLQYFGMKLASYYYFEEEEGGTRRKVGGDDEILLEELQVLKKLKVLEITLTSFSGLMKLFSNRRLLKRTQVLQLQNVGIPDVMNISLLAQSKHLGMFIVLCCDFEELKNGQESTGAIQSPVLTQTKSLDSITTFIVGGCDHLKDITCVISMPNLRKLYVHECKKIREIISSEKMGEVALGGEAYQIFSSLAILDLDDDLPMLKSIYPSNTLSMRFLYQLIVDDCPQLKSTIYHHRNQIPAWSDHYYNTCDSPVINTGGSTLIKFI